MEFIKFADPLVVRPLQVGEFLDFIRSTGGQARFNQSRSALSSFYDFCIRSGTLHTVNPVTAYKTRVARTSRKKLIPNELIFYRVVSGEQLLRNQIMLHSAFVLGLRCFEIASVRAKFFKVGDDGVVHLHIQGKGARLREIEIPDWLWNIIAAYIDQLGLHDNDFLFFPWEYRSRPLTVRQIHSIFVTAGRRVGFSGFIGPHLYRRGHATSALINGASLKALMDAMGHVSLSTLQRYVEDAKMSAPSRFIKTPEEILESSTIDSRVVNQLTSS